MSKHVNAYVLYAPIDVVDGGDADFPMHLEISQLGIQSTRQA